MTIRTALLEARLIEGDAKLFETLRARFDKEIVAKTASEFVAAKLAERDARIKRAGDSRYLVEPNVKEGKGGLRDLNTLFWIAKYVYRVRDPHELVAAGLFSQREFALFPRCEEFLWSVRCHLHFLTGRAEERLSFDLQRPIAERLGYTRARRPERRRALHEALFPHRQGRRRSHRDRLRGAGGAAGQADPGVRPVPRPPAPPPARGRRTPSISASTHDRVNVIDADAFERDPVNLIRLFWVADRSGLAIHPDATRLVTQSLKRIDARCATIRRPTGCSWKS